VAACVLRDEWLQHGLATAPADRAAAEAAVIELYRLIGEPPPRFAWVPSPVAAVPVVAEDRRGQHHHRLGTLSAAMRSGEWPLVSRLASLVIDLRSRLDTRIARGHRRQVHWQDLRQARSMPPEEALAAKASVAAIIEAAVNEPLTASLRDAVRVPMYKALLAAGGNPLSFTWFGQHDAYWVADYDIHQRTGLVTYLRDDVEQLELWATLARTAGWWWPDQGLCVMSERPAEMSVEPAPGGLHGEVRLHRSDGPAVRFPDGAQVYVVHGTYVPDWVVEDPTVERIHREPNVEVRRTAIERIGWDTYIDQAGLDCVASAPDPGNPDSGLYLYQVPQQGWEAPARVLVVVNGSAEPDGKRRRYGLSVPADIDDPVAAAAWTYGLTADQYAKLLRRT